MDPITFTYYMQRAKAADDLDMIAVPAHYLRKMLAALRDADLAGADPQTVAERWAQETGAPRFRGGPVPKPTTIRRETREPAAALA